MGATGTFDIDPNGDNTGAFGITADGSWMICGDCCEPPPSAPCDVCQETQTSTLTLTVSDAEACDAGCADAAQVGVPWYGYGTVGSSYCWWRWAYTDAPPPGNYQELLIQYYPATGVWLASASAGSGLGISSWARNPITGVTCNPGGQLSGSFSLDGLDMSGDEMYDCSGCTLNVTIVPT